MTRTALAIAAGICLLAPGRSLPAPAGESARDAVFEALASKADLPAVRPVLPSLIAERDALRQPDDVIEGAKRAKASKEVRGAARSEAAKANASAARAEAARALGAAKDDARRAAEKVREEKTRKKPKPPKPPKPPHPGGAGSP